MTNFERIKAMTIEEMAEFMSIPCECEVDPAKEGYVTCGNSGCIRKLKLWLESEVQEDEMVEKSKVIVGVTKNEEAIVDMLAVLLPDLQINIMYGFDCIETPEGGIGFGVYDVKNRTIYVAGDMPDADYEIPYTIFHELYHDYEITNFKASCEDKADEFAETMCKVLGIKRGTGK